MNSKRIVLVISNLYHFKNCSTINANFIKWKSFLKVFAKNYANIKRISLLVFKLFWKKVKQCSSLVTIPFTRLHIYSRSRRKLSTHYETPGLLERDDETYSFATKSRSSSYWSIKTHTCKYQATSATKVLKDKRRRMWYEFT